MEKEFTYVIKENGWKVSFTVRQGVFYPTDTTTLLIDACRRVIGGPVTMLDLGCGCGAVGITLGALGLSRGAVFASDISEIAVCQARENAKRQSVGYVARSGSMFEPWEGETFDVIVDDVAGISDDIARISPWYEGVSCDAGRDGVKWIVEIIRRSKEHLKDSGTLIFPVLSLSSESRILQALDGLYPPPRLVAKKEWFLPDCIAKRPDVLMPLVEDGTIQCQKKYGKWIWHTSIYAATKEGETR